MIEILFQIKKPKPPSIWTVVCFHRSLVMWPELLYVCFALLRVSVDRCDVTVAECKGFSFGHCVLPKSSVKTGSHREWFSAECDILTSVILRFPP